MSFYSSSNLDVPGLDSHISRADDNTAVLGGDISLTLPSSHPITPVVKNKDKYDDELTAKSALVIDEKTRRVLYSHQADKIRPLASITKLMSAIVLLDLSLDWPATTTITEADGNGDQHVQLGEEYTLEDLWQAALIGSSNRAIRALVRISDASDDGFNILLDKKAKELDLQSLKFFEPTGLSEKNIGKAEDVANLLKEAMRFDKIYTSLQIGEQYIQPLNKEKLRRIWSTNWLLTNWIPNDFAVKNMVGKTGYISESGYNFVVSLEKNNHKIRYL